MKKIIWLMIFLSFTIGLCGCNGIATQKILKDNKVNIGDNNICKYSAEDAINLVANTYYNGSKENLLSQKLKDDVYVITLSQDFGSGLLTTVNAFLVVNGKITESLVNDATGEENEKFWTDVNKLR